jgi:hypothetical protein
MDLSHPSRSGLLCCVSAFSACQLAGASAGPAARVRMINYHVVEWPVLSLSSDGSALITILPATP